MAAFKNSVRKHIYRKDVLIDASGAKVDISRSVWQLNDPTRKIRIDWGRLPISSVEIIEATREFIASMIRTQSANSVVRAYSSLCLLSKSPSFVSADTSEEEIPTQFFVELRNYLGPEAAYRLHDVRQWFQFCCDYGAAQFSPEVAFHLSERIVGGNKKGFKVLSMDPRDGPIDDTELAHVIAALKSRTKAVNQINAVDLSIWLMLALGCNPAQLALLRESDFTHINEAGVEFYFIKVPRIKKRLPRPRMEFRSRRLDVDVARLVLMHIENNKNLASYQVIKSEIDDVPLFIRKQKRSTFGNVREFDWHWLTSEFSAATKKWALDNKVYSARAKDVIALSPRRLRYTFASRLVKNGASQIEVAEALDHTDVQNVHVYFETGPSIVDSLDGAMGEMLAELACGFLGKIINEDAAQKRRLTREISYQSAETGEMFSSGGCAKKGLCDEIKPFECYSCIHLRAFIDAPHEEILDDLVKRRSLLKEQGHPEHLIHLLDPVIAAVADVVQQVKQARGESGV